MGQKESRLLGPHKRWIERKRIQRSERPPPLGAESITPPEPHSSAVLAIGSVDHGIQENGTLTRPREVNTKGLGSQPWYFGDVTRENAEALLLEPSNEHGSFLVRIQGTTAQGTTAQGHCLSVRDGDLVKHFRLHEEGGHVSIAPGQTFSSIIMLISYFLEHDVPQICLRQPCEQVQSCKSSSSKTFQEATNQKLDLWEIQRDALMFIRILGTGEFGEVWQGLWNKSTPVAIKTMKPGSMDVSSFMDEARLMKCFRHPHLVCLYAVCSTEEPLFIITEYLAHGALRDFLRGPEGQTLSPSILIGMAAQVASGMAYLESHSFIHRDLAARNVLVGEGLMCKVADFGLAKTLKGKSEYVAQQGSRFPIKWTAPEANNYNIFTSKSDVWSFGVFLYELFSYGQEPYQANQGTPKTRRGYRHRNYWECRWSERTRKSKNDQDIKDIEAKLYFHTGKGKNKRTIDVQQIFHHFGKEVCSALVGFHCFSGCDSVSALHGMGKVKAVKILMASKEHCSTFEKLGAAFEIPETLYAGLEVFTCVLYGQTNCKDVNHARYQMFKSGRCVEKCLPPNKDSLHKHIQ